MTASVTILSAHAAASLLAAIWQGALLALCAALCLRLLPRLSAATRSAIWMTVFAIAVALHFMPASHPVASTAEVHASPVWSLVFVAVWLVCSLFRAGQLLLGVLRVREVNRRAISLERGSGIPQIGRRYQVCVSPDVDRPSVLGFFSPRVLLPAGLAEKLTPAELHQVLLHETEHLRRSDDWTNLLQKLALVVFPLNPALLYIERRLCEERELACDDRVLSSAAASGGRKAYATCLTQLAEHAILRRGLSLALGAWHRESELSRRVHRILAPAEILMPPRAARFAATGLAVVLAATGGILARAPRLISFDPVAPQPTEQASVIHQPVVGKPVLAEAVVPSTTLGAPGLSSETWVRSRTKSHRQSRKHTEPQFLSTTWRTSDPVPRLTITLRTAYVEPDPQPARPQPVQSQSSLQAVPAVYRVPVAYAAFHTPDGWIIFQL
jgi:Zn-dependent protease with chaperone function